MLIYKQNKWENIKSLNSIILFYINNKYFFYRHITHLLSQNTNISYNNSNNNIGKYSSQ